MGDNVQQIEQFREQVLAAARDGRALRIRGGGTKDWYGQASDGDILDTRGFSGIVDYEPTELVITARCGTPLAEIEAALAERKQMLAFEPPHFGAGATIGGVVASGLSGPRRAGSGALRDFVLGAVLMDGKGEVLTFGGQVMKNVAGYDVSRLLAGSMGTLGLMLQHSIKVLPRAPCDITLRFAMDEIEALQRLNEWAGLPLPISASCWHAGVLTLRLSGAQAAVDAAARTLGGQPVDDGGAFWAALREQRHAFFDGAASLWRLSVPSSTGAIILRGAQLIEWGGAQRWLKVDADVAMAHNIRRAVTAVGGHATLFRGGDKRIGVFQPLAPGVARIHQRLKAAFDPSQVFNPGRMY
ncbi:glycolate oxidase subunit GlcE [Massilia scottii]|uniref:glycolate oxidase subunit GlcE n=1 Tax=Massilia scottii TaxID=3057166 RepID=UPI0027964EBF|nr:glycolate oxidase subunit GlcE [Massilia sp. CCM 9029]MDQ1834058.1 glycolate oxidase subunit GlcE [Massilia sp. CCM 9029]